MAGSKLFRLFGLLLVLFGLPAFAADDEINTGSVLLSLIADGIYAVEPNYAGANGALILNDTGSIVVDSHGSPASARALIKAAAQISDQPIRYVINTHWHVDHHSGNEAYKEAFGDGVVFISHDETRNDIPVLGEQQFADVAPYRETPIQSATGELAAGTDSHGRPLTDKQLADIAEFRDAQVEFATREVSQFELANLTYEKSVTLFGQPHTAEIFYLYPGHTKSDSVIYLREQEVLIVGDLLTKPILWAWSSYPASYVETLKALEQIPAKKIVIGHGGPVLAGKDYLVQARQFLEVVLDYSTRSFASRTSEDGAINAAVEQSEIQDFRRAFVAEEQDGMFDQMVAWIISRSYLELSSE